MTVSHSSQYKKLLKRVLPKAAKDYWYTYHFKKRMYDPDGWERHVYDRIIQSYRTHERFSRELSYTYMGYNFIDVGGFVGRYTYLVGREAGTNVWTYEPIPGLYKMIFDKTKKMRNVNLYNYALGEVDEERVIHQYKFSPNLPDSMSSGNTFNEDFGKSYKADQKAFQELTIRIRRFDDVVELGIPVHGMKIDTEGWEVQVLNGAEEHIKRYRPDLFLEYHGNKTDMMDWLKNHNYTKLEWLDETDQFKYGLHGHMVAWA